LALGIALTTAACGGKTEGGKTALARVANHVITEADVDARINEVPQLARPEYSGPIGRSRMLRQMIEEEVLYRAAVDDGLERDPDVRRRLDSASRQILVQSYLDRQQAVLSQVREDEAREYYKKHEDEYRTEKLLRVRVLVAQNRPIAVRAREMAVEGQPFDELCRRFSTDPFVIEAKGLLPTWVRRNKAVPWLGNHPVFHDAVFGLAAGELSEVLETPKGFLVARVEEVREEKQRTFEEARADIEARLARERSTKGLPELIDDLKKRYRVEMVEPKGRSADELFALAQQAVDPNERIALYEELVERFPKSQHVVEALFMIGFTKSEELKDPQGAAVLFQRVVDEFPESELAQSAKWMLTSEQEGAPPFEPDPGDTASTQEATP
jgi:peptidyl-prolyl cis-trans isomerase C